jgi:hypothetical protein
MEQVSRNWNSTRNRSKFKSFRVSCKWVDRADSRLDTSHSLPSSCARVPCINDRGCANVSVSAEPMARGTSCFQFDVTVER